MEFKKFNEQIQKQFAKMCETGKLFRVEMTGREVWDLYLKSFKPEDNQKFRDPASSEHNCNYCNNFIRRYGNIVAISDKSGTYEAISIFSNLNTSEEYQDVADIVAKAVIESPIKDVFFETKASLQGIGYPKTKVVNMHQLGVPKNLKRYTREEAELYGVVKPNEVREFHHFNLLLPKRFVATSGSIEAIEAQYRDLRNVYARAMSEISLDTLDLVKQLIKQGSLLDGEAHLHSIEEHIILKNAYVVTQIPGINIENYLWFTAYNLSERTAKFRNTLMGTLCVELSEGEDLNKACENWNKRVDPANYHKAVAPITQRQIKEAQKFVEENGYTESFDRRFATMEDIKADEIKHINAGDGKIEEVSIFDKVKPSTSTQHKRSQFDKVEEVSIDTFMKDILPTCTQVEALFENKHQGNLVTLLTANNPDSKPIFKWTNNFAWTFNGNLAGKSQIKQAVKTAGGAVDGVLRFSIRWAEGNGDNSDLDAHCVINNKRTIYFSAKNDSKTGGQLDIDIQVPSNYGANVVENITFPSLEKLENGTYQFLVHQYSANASKGFTAEIEFNGNIYSYTYDKPLRQGVKVKVAKVSFEDGEFKIFHDLEETNASKEVWNIKTEEFHRVNLVCLTPNHWGENAVGNKHYLFMLDGCKTDSPTRTFHNESLIPELLKHRKVMEVLGMSSTIEPADKQLSGIGFNATVRDRLIVKVSGSFKRMLKIKF